MATALGHERGAFIGSVTRSTGRFERANRGTLFLDEIGDLPLELQAKLLRVIQERQFERLGSTATIHADLRVICATHGNLVEMIESREFRADLVFPVELPPLRERPEDIRLLVRHFAMNYARRMRTDYRDCRGVHHGVCALYLAGQYPRVAKLHRAFGNLSNGPVLTGSLSDLTCAQKASSPVTLEEAESSHILQTLRQTGGVVGGPNGAAARLGLRRTTLISKMRRLGLNRGQSSALRVPAVASAPSSEDPTLRMPRLIAIARAGASSGNSNPHSGGGRAYAVAKA